MNSENRSIPKESQPHTLRSQDNFTHGSCRVQRNHRMKIKILATVVFTTAGCLLTACTSNPNRTSSDPDAFHRTLNSYLESTHNHPVSKNEYDVAFANLNGDRFEDAIVLFGLNTTWAGSGGSTLFIFKGTSKGFVFLSKTTVTRAPVCIRNTENYGWKDLVVHSSGGGLPPSERLLVFDGDQYSPNTSMAQETTILDSDSVIINHVEQVMGELTR